MSDAAARIIHAIQNTGAKATPVIFLATVSSIAPVTLQLDDVSFPIDTGVMVNELLLGCENEKLKLKSGDRVVVANIDTTCFVVLCKAVSSG